MRRATVIFLLCSASLFSFDIRPWFGDVLEFNWKNSYIYQRYSHVSRSLTPLASPSNDHFLYSDLSLCFLPQWNIDLDILFPATPMQSFSFGTTGLQLRYLWLDDIVGDLLTLTTGGTIRYVSQRTLHDISDFFHGDVEFTGNFSIGKEWDYFTYWRYRSWGYGYVGFSNRGSPWFGGYAGIQAIYDDCHRLEFCLNGAHGYGKNRNISINDFTGYGKVRYKFIDLGLEYSFQFPIWGTLSLGYQRRVLAKACPSNANIFWLSYLLPFSF